jgi:hypothetical protein
VSSLSSVTISTSYGFFSTLSSGTIYGKFIGDGSQLTGIAIPPILSTTLLSTTVINASLGIFSSISATTYYISSLTVDSLFIGSNTGYINMGDVIATSLSTSILNVGYIGAQTISTIVLSTTLGIFSTISSGTIYGKFIGDGSQLTGISGTGSYSVPPILSTNLLSTGLLTASNISAISLSTNYGFFSTLSSGQISGKFIGDGSGLLNVTTSSVSLSSGNISISTITLMDTTNRSSGTIFERSSLLYFNTFVIGGASVWTSQLFVGN